MKEPTKATLAAALLAICIAGCSSGTLRLRPPECAPATSRTSPTEIDLDPIGTAAAGAIVTPVPIVRPGPAAVLTSGMNAELHGRALQGGPAGFLAQCSLDRFAIRTHSAMSSSSALSTMFVDLSCTARRREDQALVWRGELRARAAATAGVLFAGDDGSLESRVTRMFGDAARELASDLVRALGLGSSPSARVFRDESAARIQSGIDDTPLGPAALAEKAEGVAPVLPSLKDEESALTRASAWNVVAMAAGPDDPWLAGTALALDQDVYVRFYQYKALARLGTPAALKQLDAALGSEDEPQLLELVRDSIGSRGIGVTRSTKASAATNGSTTSP
jgi:hypothetical protein